MLSPLLLALLLGAPQAPETEPSELFLESIEVDIVNVDTFVTDRDGRPITGLTVDDFELFEDGQQVQITNFFAASPKPIPGESEPLRAPPPPTPGEQKTEQAVAEQRTQRHLIIYVDSFNLRPETRNRVLHRTRRLLRDAVEAGAQVMVVSYEHSLKVKQSFTSDIQLLTTALIDLEELTGQGTIRDSERKLMLEEIEVAKEGQQALLAARGHADSVLAEMTIALRGLQDFIGLLSGIEGRTALLYISDGLPRIAAEDLFIAVDERFPRSMARTAIMAYDMRDRYRAMIHTANSGNVTLYTLQALGSRAFASISAAEGGTLQGGGRPFVDSIHQSNMQEPLQILAADTGGIAVTGTNAVEVPLRRLTNDFQSYYSLGFRRHHAISGRYHQLEVKLKNKIRGVEIRHREGYRAKTPETDLTETMLALLQFGTGPNPLGLRLRFEHARPQEDSLGVPMLIEIPLGKLLLVPQGNEFVGRFRPVVGVMDETGRITPKNLAPVAVNIPAQDLERAKGQYYVYELQLTMNPGVHQVAIGVRDELAARSSFLREVIHVGSR